MKKKSVKTINIATVVIFAAAFFLNVHSGNHIGVALAIGQGTGTGTGTGTGSGGERFTIDTANCTNLIYCYDDSGKVCGNVAKFGTALTCPPGTEASCTPIDCNAGIPDPSKCSCNAKN